jgi:hypothetical protein
MTQYNILTWHSPLLIILSFLSIIVHHREKLLLWSWSLNYGLRNTFLELKNSGWIFYNRRIIDLGVLTVDWASFGLIQISTFMIYYTRDSDVLKSAEIILHYLWGIIHNRFQNLPVNICRWLIEEIGMDLQIRKLRLLMFLISLVFKLYPLIRYFYTLIQTHF